MNQFSIRFDSTVFSALNACTLTFTYFDNISRAGSSIIGMATTIYQSKMWYCDAIPIKILVHYPFIIFGSMNTNDIQPSSDENAIFEFQYNSHILTFLIKATTKLL